MHPWSETNKISVILFVVIDNKADVDFERGSSNDYGCGRGYSKGYGYERGSTWVMVMKEVLLGLWL